MTEHECLPFEDAIKGFTGVNSRDWESTGIILYFVKVQKYEDNTLTLLRTETSKSPLASHGCSW